MRIVKKNVTYFLNLKDEKDKKIIDNYLFSEIELKEVSEDVLCFVKVEKEKTIKTTDSKKEEVKDQEKKTKEEVKQEAQTSSKQKIVDLLNDKSLEFKNKVEGNFEKLLTKKDLEIFKEMLKKKEIILYKLSTKYKKSFYKPMINTNPENKTEDKDKEIENTFEDFKKEAYTVLSNDALAQQFSQVFADQLRVGEIRGTKSFDGRYYVIYTYLFEKISKQILKEFSSDFTVEEAVQKLKQTEDIVRCVLEILKEDCAVIEKRKGVYYKV